MTPQLFLPLLTYPDANAEAIAANAVAVAAQMHGALHAVAFNAEISGVSSALSRKLLNVPAMIREAESSSSQRGDVLLRKLAELAGSAEIAVTTERKAGRHHVARRHWRPNRRAISTFRLLGGKPQTRPRKQPSERSFLDPEGRQWSFQSFRR